MCTNFVVPTCNVNWRWSNNHNIKKINKFGFQWLIKLHNVFANNNYLDTKFYYEYKQITSIKITKHLEDRSDKANAHFESDHAKRCSTKGRVYDTETKEWFNSSIISTDTKTKIAIGVTR